MRLTNYYKHLYKVTLMFRFGSTTVIASKSDLLCVCFQCPTDRPTGCFVRSYVRSFVRSFID